MENEKRCPGELSPEEQREILEVAILAGQILLENGAELFRVEDTMERICCRYGIQSVSFFALSHVIFMTSGSEREENFAKVQHVPVGGTRLDRVAAVNQLSREIVKDCLSIGEIKKRLNQIRGMKGESSVIQILASGIGSACFCYLAGGTLLDSLSAFISGVLLYVYVIYFSSLYLSKIVGSIGGGAVVAFSCTILYLLRFGEHLNYIIICSIMPLIPGVTLINAIRDIVEGNYIFGSVRLLDSLLVFFWIATGVGLVLSLFRYLTGGALL
ncbi:threonine/serine exporter ThrE family protein [Lacrimispora sp.]|uniref:threonine/serine ThrE exporter family protein n=1 Tax=Lacrimispora sp. TaxID=2719234 RepID=UPI00345FFEB4